VLTASLGREGLIAAWRDLPNIIILDPVLPDIPGLELVTRLRHDRRTSQVILVALSSRENPQEMTAMLAGGCSEYLVKSSQTLQKLQDILSRVLGRKEQIQAKRGRLIVFLSAKGGTGTSSLCANIAMCLASEKTDQRVAVMDLVLPIGSIAQIVGYEEGLNLVTAAMQDPDHMTAAYFKDNLPLVSGWYFHLLAGATDPESANRVSSDQISKLLNAIVEAYDFIFVDLGRSLSRISVPIIQRADVVVLILGTDLATANLTQTAWNYLKTLGVDSQRIYAIQNRAIGLEGLTKAELEKMLGLTVAVTMPYMGDNFTVANNRHEPLTSGFSNNSVTLLLKQIANQMVTPQ
jgi:pilus assembly protein CpaE